MSVKISGEEAYQAYSELKLRKDGQKSAKLENISAILMNFRVEVNPKPTDPVSFKFPLHSNSSYEIDTILVLYQSYFSFKLFLVSCKLVIFEKMNK